MNAIVGTAGHIDHGKSALVRALTGIDTDRLPEERERGISIELGFAHLELAGLGRVGVVDVPGHERFIRQMLAGAHGFDLVLLVVAADDGVMPQTEEHFDIVHLLGIERGIFVITKIDAVTPERIDEVRGEIEILAVGTRFEEAPVVAVSARSGEGIEELRAAIAAALAALPPKARRGTLRIPVDRVFVMKGHGVVVTGTALAGEVRVGDEVTIAPAGLSARVREVQVHGEARESAGAGERVALNLAGLDKEDIARGDSVTSPSAQAPTLRLDARVEIRPAAGKPLASHRRVRVHHGTRETLARLVWLDGLREVAPRGSAYAQLALDEPLVAAAGDRFVLRDETASRTIGGGSVLLTHATKHRLSQGEVSPALRDLEDGETAGRLRTLLSMSPQAARTPEEAAAALGIEGAELRAALRGSEGIAALPDAKQPQLLLTSETLASLLAQLHAGVSAFLEKHPSAAGVDLEHLRSGLRPSVDALFFRLLVDRATADGSLQRRANLLSPRGHAASLSSADESLATRVLERIAGAGVMPPSVKELAEELGVDVARVVKVAGVLVLREELQRISPELYFRPAILEEIAAKLRAYLEEHGEITASAFRDLIAASRKYCIPLLDCFDRSGLTIRVGDLRRLRRRS